MGRGGSDYSAALLGEALDATQVSIWTDVAGIYTTDPRITSHAKQIQQISFSEASEMATFGAKVLHPATLLPAVRAKIPVFVGASHSPELNGTQIQAKVAKAPHYRALAVRRSQTLLTLHSLEMVHSCGFLANVFAILAKHKLSVDLITTSEVSVSLTLDNTAATMSEGTLLNEAVLAELSAVCRVEVESDLALVALIGNDLKKQGATAPVFSALSPFALKMICYGASAHNLCVLVEQNIVEDLIQQLHVALFE